MRAKALARLDRIFRKPATRLITPAAVVRIYSKGRIRFLKKLIAEHPKQKSVPEELGVTLWGIHFRSPIMNASGMFKNGQGYELACLQGAGAWLAGTTTGKPRPGNEKHGIFQPFAPYPFSEAASNWLGNPNEGHHVVAPRISKLEKVDGCPIGISLMGNPDGDESESLRALVEGLTLFTDAGVDFIEINESCPNMEGGLTQKHGLHRRLEHVRDNFFSDKKGNRPPVIVKFSNDTPLTQVPDLIKALVELGFDGVNFGNTSVRYEELEGYISLRERKLYRAFTRDFGGGVSGRPLKEFSLALVREASKCVRELSPAQEFHVIRTGGVLHAADVVESFKAGASLVQWYTGYFEAFSSSGHKLYQRFYNRILSELKREDITLTRGILPAASETDRILEQAAP